MPVTKGASIKQGAAVASTSGTAIDFTGIPESARRVTVLLSGVSTNGTTNLLIRVGAGSIEASGYSSSGLSQNSGGGLTAITDESAFIAGYFQNNGNAASGAVVLTKLTGNTWVASASVGMGAYAVVAGGTKTLAGALDRVRITTVNGTDTFDAGNVNIVWE